MTTGSDDATRHEGSGPLDPEATRYEGPGPQDPEATRHEGPGSPDPDATRHEGAASAPGARWFGSLPGGVTARFEFVRGLSTSGGQADILLCRDRTSGEEVVVKLYRGRPQIDLSTYDKLGNIGDEHVTPIVELKVEDDGTWEVQEFFRHGSLHDLVRLRGDGPQPATFVTDVVSELTPALDALHSAGITHRDLKPGNVFVRSVAPLDLVLGDFGFARDLTMSSEYMSVVGVFHYTAPEVLRGLVSHAADWWSLGVIVYELLTGHSLFRDADGRREANPHVVRGHLDRGEFSIDDVADPRWHLLLRGLLNRSREHRWNHRQVTEWLEGGSPEVVEEAPAPTTARPQVEVISVPGGSFTDPAAAIESLVAHWDAACGYLVGQNAAHLRQWLEKTSVGDAATGTLTDVRNTVITPQAALVQLQVLIRPGQPVVFSGRRVDSGTLTAAAQGAASGDVADQEWIRSLRTHQVLGAMASRVEGGHRLVTADVRLQQYWNDLPSLLTAARATPALRDFVSTLEGTLEGIVLATALDEQQPARHRAAAREVAARLTQADPELLRTLAAAAEQGAVPASLVLEFVGRPAVDAREARTRAETERQQRAETERIAREAKQRVDQRRRARVDRARQAGRRARTRLVMGAVLVALLVGALVSQGLGPEWTAQALALGAPLLASVGLAFALEAVVPLSPPRVAHAVGAAALVWRGVTTVPLTAPVSRAFEVAQWLTALSLWFVGGYAVGYGVGLLAERIRGTRSSEVAWSALAAPAAVLPVATVLLVLERLGADADVLAAGPTAQEVAQAVVVPGVSEVLGVLPMGQLALAAAVAAVVALSTTGETRRLPQAVQKVGWLALWLVSAAVVLYFLPLMVSVVWAVVAAVALLGMIAFAVSVPTA